MSRDKRKHGSLDAFFIITKRALIAHSSSEQATPDQSDIASVEAAQPVDLETEEPENNDSSDLNHN